MKCFEFPKDFFRTKKNLNEIIYEISGATSTKAVIKFEWKWRKCPPRRTRRLWTRAMTFRWCPTPTRFESVTTCSGWSAPPTSMSKPSKAKLSFSSRLYNNNNSNNNNNSSSSKMTRFDSINHSTFVINNVKSLEVLFLFKYSNAKVQWLMTLFLVLFFHGCSVFNWKTLKV